MRSGSNDPFQLEPVSLPKVPELPKRAVAKPVPKAKPATPAKPPADRRALDAAEAALHQLDEARKCEEANLRRRQDKLDTAKSQAQSDDVEHRKAATAAVIAARQAYRAAGGED